MLLLRPLALCFLVSASAFSLAKLIQTDPDFRRELIARVAVFEQTVWQPAIMHARAAADNLFAAPTSDARVVLALAPPTPAEERVVARVELAPIERSGIEERSPAMLDTPFVIAPTLPAGLDVVVIARPGCAEYVEEKGSAAIGERLAELAEKVTRPREESP